MLPLLKACIPWTKEFKNRRKKEILSIARNEISHFKSLECVDESSKSDILKKIRRHEVLVASHKVSDSAIAGFELAIIGAFALSMMICAPIFSKELVNIDYSSVGWVGVIISIFFKELIALLILVIPVIIIPDSKNAQGYFRSLGSLIFAWMIFIISVYIYSIYNIIYIYGPDELSIGVYEGLSALLMVVVYMIGAFMILMLSILFRKIFTRSIKERFPIEFISTELCKLLFQIEKSSEKWMSIEFQNDLMSKIEVIASCVERNLSSKYSSGDRSTNYWVRDNFSNIASGIRLTKRWICKPEYNTYKKLVRYLSDTTKKFILGDWGNICMSKPEKMPGPAFVRIIIRGFGIMVSGLSPFIILVYIQKTSLSFDKEIYENLKVGAYIWAILSLIYLIDPTFGERINVVRDVLRRVRGSD